MKNGVPWDVAFSLPEDEAYAYGIVFGEFEGHTFDFENGRWKETDQ